MNEDTMKEIINDVKDLASTRKNPLTRLALDGIANRLEKLVAGGLYITPKAALDVANAEQPVVDGPSLNEVFKKGLDIPPVPPTKKRSWLELPRGVTLRRFCGADRSVTFVGQYRSTDPGELGASDSRPLRVYTIRLEHRANTAWNATVTENDMILFEIQTSCGGRSMAEYVAVKAMKAWLRYLSHSKGKACAKRHRKALKQRKKAARRAAKEVA